MEMKLKQVEQFLQQVDDFESPKIKYEQYATNAHLAGKIRIIMGIMTHFLAHMIYTAANSFEDIREKSVADFGCGCGMLSIAATLMGAEKVYSIDIDPDALAICKRNLEDLGIIDLVSEDEECSVETRNSVDSGVEDDDEEELLNDEFGHSDKDKFSCSEEGSDVESEM